MAALLRALVAGVITRRGGRRLFQLHAQHLAHRIVRGGHVAQHVHVGNIERVADLVEAVRFTVVGKLSLDLQPGRAQQIAKDVLVFVTVSLI